MPSFPPYWLVLSFHTLRREQLSTTNPPHACALGFTCPDSLSFMFPLCSQGRCCSLSFVLFLQCRVMGWIDLINSPFLAISKYVVPVAKQRLDAEIALWFVTLNMTRQEKISWISFDDSPENANNTKHGNKLSTHTSHWSVEHKLLSPRAANVFFFSPNLFNSVHVILIRMGFICLLTQ